MSATPTTTRLGPDQALLRDLMRRLAEATSTEAPILSAYVDVRPEGHGERPGERNELIVLRDRLSAICAGLDAHSVARESAEHDRDRIERLPASEDLAGVEGIAVFACDRIGLWEAIGSEVAFDTEVSSGPTPDLFQLARLLDDQVSAVVAVVDTNTCRLFVTRRGGLDERPGRDEGPEEHRRREAGGWAQARYQRHIDMQDRRFAREAAEAIDRLVRREKPAHVLLAGDERAISVLEGQLTSEVRRLVEHVARIQVRSSVDDVREEIAPILSALEEAEGMEAADRAVAGWRAGALGTVGIDGVMAALEFGQVDELIVDETMPIDEDLRGELIRQAALTDAHVEVVREHPQLARHDGLAATLRYRR